MSARWYRPAALLAAGLVALVGGCASQRQTVITPVEGMPRELRKTTLPDYVIEAPDVLQVDLVAAVPKPPYRIQPLDTIGVRVPQSLTAPGTVEPINGAFPVELDGTVNLGPSYGAVPVARLTLPEARAAIEKFVGRIVQKPEAIVTLLQGRGVQQVRGPHLVRGDGTIGLGSYGSVRVVGLTVPQAKKAIEVYLSEFFLEPEISLDVTGFNSKVYYMVIDGGNAGTQVVRLPLTGNETVLDAMSQIGGLPAIGDPEKVWVARPSVEGCPDVTILPVDWACVTEYGDTRTNYQLMAGDRVFVKAYRMVSFGNRFGRVIAPIERILGFTLLGVGTVRQFDTNNNNGFGNVGGIR